MKVYKKWFSESMCIKPHLLFRSNRMLQNILYLGISKIFTTIKPKQNAALSLSGTLDIFLPFNFVLATLTVEKELEKHCSFSLLIKWR